MRVYFLKHGEDTLNKRGGWSIEPLTANGVNQIKAVASLLEGIQFDRVLSSDLVRTMKMTEIL